MTKKTTIKKKLTLLLSTMYLLFSVISCSSESSNPQTVAIAFAENVAKGKIKAAKKYATETSGMLLDLTAKNAGLSIFPDASYSIVKDSITGKKGFVQLKDNNSKKGTLEWYAVVKVDDEWKVDLDKTIKRQQRVNAQKRKERNRKKRETVKKVNDKLFSVE